ACAVHSEFRLRVRIEDDVVAGFEVDVLKGAGQRPTALLRRDLDAPLWIERVDGVGLIYDEGVAERLKRHRIGDGDPAYRGRSTEAILGDVSGPDLGRRDERPGLVLRGCDAGDADDRQPDGEK